MSKDQSTLREIVDGLAMMKDQVKTLESILKDTIKSSFNLEPGIIDDILPYTLEDIENFDEPKCREVLSKYCEPNAMSTTIKNLMDENEDITTENQAFHFILKSVKEDSLKLLSSKMDVKKVEEASEELLNEVIADYNSPESVEKRRQELVQMQESIDNETDEDKKKEMQNKLMVLSKAFSLDFFTERLKNLGEKEVKNILDAFFNNSKGAYIINRFRNTVRQMKTVSPEIYRNFFNIEQYFCGEEYYKYNNLFLFIYMRFIAYSNPYNKNDKIYAQAITSAISNLMYHRFGNVEYESDMVNLVKTVDDYFKDYADMFENDNLMNPNHPKNIERTQTFNNERKAKIKVVLDKYNIPVEDFDSKTPDELQKILTDGIDAMIEQQVNDYNELHKEVEEVEEVDPDHPDVPVIKTEEEFENVLNEQIEALPDDPDEEEPSVIEQIENPPVIDNVGLSVMNVDTGEMNPISLPGIQFNVLSTEEK